VILVASVLWRDDAVLVRGVRQGERIGAAALALPAGLCDDEHVFARATGGRPMAHVPADAVAELRSEDGSRRRVVGAASVALRECDVVSIELGEIRIRNEALSSSEEIARAPRSLLGGARAHVVAAAVAHAMLLGGSAVLASPADPEAIDAERIYAIQAALQAADERELEDAENEKVAEDEKPSRTPATPSRRVERAAPAREAAVEHRGDLLDVGSIGIPQAPEAVPEGERIGRRARVSLDASASEIEGARPDPIQRTLRQHLDRFQACYEGGRPSGGDESVVVRFEVERGQVSGVRDAGSDMRDPAVVGCALRAVSGMSFPLLPEDGAISATIPIRFSAR
jgi:hypothetical protein